MPECPDCSKSFDSEKGLKVHHGQKHDGSYGKNEVECPICDTTHYVADSRIERYENHPCSKECFKELRSQQSVGEKNNMYDKNHSEKSVQKMKENTDNSGKKNPMYGKTGEENPNYGKERPEHSEKMSGKGNPMYGKYGDSHARGGKTNSKEHNQAIKEYMLSENHHYRGKNLPEEVRKKIAENTPSGEEHWNWKGGISRDINMGSNWNEQREKAIQRDNEKCQKCGLSREKHKQRYGKDISVDHIIPRRMFDEEEIEEKANRLENLRTYCISCHQELEAEKSFLRSPVAT